MFFPILFILAAIFVIVAIVLLLRKRKTKELNSDVVQENRIKEPPAGSHSKES
jgi:preprotein translocase subunit SecG